MQHAEQGSAGPPPTDGGPTRNITVTRLGSARSPVRRALTFIERSLTDNVCLDDVSSASGLSRYQLSRAFVAATGVPVMHYVRARRLTEAAHVLAAGAPDILTLALEYGYGSHEAFTRAFTGRFLRTPESVRADGHTGDLDLMEALIMPEQPMTRVSAPREVLGRARLVAGLKERYTLDTNHAIPSLWQRFVPRMGEIRDIDGTGTYGVCRHAGSEGEFDYLAGVAVTRADRLPADFHHVALPACRYAVFEHTGHTSTIRDTVRAIWNHALHDYGYQPADHPDFEYYAAERFDPVTNSGQVEIWVPVV